MSLSQEQLAERLQGARIAVGLTQEEASKKLGISRSSLAQLETGRRRVDSLELEKMVRLYELNFRDLFAEEAGEKNSVLALFRASAEIEKTPAVKREVMRASNWASEISFYEGLSGVEPGRLGIAEYGLGMPGNKQEAVEHGVRLAEEERRRMGLGSLPVWDLAGMLRRRGFRVAELNLPKGLSGFTMRLKGAGILIAVNRGHAAERRLFSYGHELCHALADGNMEAVVSGAENSKELYETRANVFAANFLMPEEGIKAFLRAELGRHYRGWIEEEHLPEAAALAGHFGVSFEAMVYRLHNLKQITDSIRDHWKAEESVAKGIKKMLRGPALDENYHSDLGTQLIEAALNAFRLEKISKKKMVELCEQVGRKAGEIEDLFKAIGWKPKAAGIVGPR